MRYTNGTMQLYKLLHTIRALLIVVTLLAGLNLVVMISGSYIPSSQSQTIEPRQISSPEIIEPIAVATTTEEVVLEEPEIQVAEEPVEEEPELTIIEEPVVEPDPEPQVVVTQPQEPAIEFVSIEEINPLARRSVVNILCTAKGSGAFHPISGSGIVIDERGVVLTNAHVAQYFLLENEIDCVLRTGSPAKTSYRAELLFLPPEWIESNASKITELSPSGTGEDDYALLYITESIRDGESLPASFDFLTPEVRNEFDSNNRTLVVAYPSELVGAIATQLNLFQVSTTARITRAFYFDEPINGNEPNIDVISIGGSIVAQGGSSGGAIIDLSDGSLIGVIVTSTRAETTGEKDLRGITLAHVDRSLQEHLGLSLEAFLQDSLVITKEWFRRTHFDQQRTRLIDLLTS